MLMARQARFVEEFSLSGSATAAAIQAGYSKCSAHMQASRLLTNDDILNALNERKRRLASNALAGQKSNKKPALRRVSWTSLDFLKLLFGGC
ncbi:MAG: hypothetical protein B7Y41_00175 [Hydrogenophilales bacterium 28-61-23]|nr:MAG: hypothetical protein B7Y41_00175 [Hydrogenophilales bacterium 28-61-23]